MFDIEYTEYKLPNAFGIPNAHKQLQVPNRTGAPREKQL
jgi:hypothetical protein